MLRLPDTGQTSGYTSTFGEDNDFSINFPFYTVNGDGTVTDTITGLMWQQVDGPEMTYANAILYCDTLTTGGYTDWRLPSAHESFSILNHQRPNPALDITTFSTTTAEYWWTSQVQVNDTTKVWVTNAGGGVGNHRKSETISAGGTKRFQVRAVRDITLPPTIPNHFTDHGDGTVTDELTGLTWQSSQYSDSITWEQALQYADTLTTGGQTDWRLPNIKELQSISDAQLTAPSLPSNHFTVVSSGKYWSSTSLPNQTAKAWYLDTQFGITTYDLKTIRHYLLCVRGNLPLINSVNVPDSQTGLFFFPNPFSNRLQLSPSMRCAKAQLMSLDGTLIYEGTDLEMQDLSRLPEGTYLLFIPQLNGKAIKLQKID